ncbi:hypothetical protein [Kitasatospora sp. NPDC005856]|uniref:hypothetical protein n=1 Tax=Kitasatospora sp. NPDC005856 TaxID=3154566 RepID=UPI0034035AF7
MRTEMRSTTSTDRRRPGRLRRLGVVSAVAVSAAGLAGGAVAAPAPTGAATTIATPVHHAYVVKMIDTGSQGNTYPETDAQLLAHVDKALDFWVDQTDQAISSFTRAGNLPTITGDCTSSTVKSDSWAAGKALFPGVTFGGTTGNHMIVLAPAGCAYPSVATTGSLANGLNSGGNVFVYDNPQIIDISLTHELGHNFSFNHANALVCSTTNGTTTCPEADYQNRYSVMSLALSSPAGSPPYLPPALSSYARDRVGVLKTCEVPSVSLGTGQHDVTATYDVWGRGSKNGTRGIKVVDPTTGDTYFLDYRDGSGRDAASYYRMASATGYNSGVTVEKVKPLSGGNTQPVLQPITQDTTWRQYALWDQETFTVGGLTVRTGPYAYAGDPSQVTVTLTNPSGTNTTLPTQQGTATVTGTPTAGQTLTANPTNWTAGSCHRYQWLDNGVPIKRARNATFTVPANPAGHVYTVQITGQQSGYQPLTATSL